MRARKQLTFEVLYEDAMDAFAVAQDRINDLKEHGDKRAELAEEKVNLEIRKNKIEQATEEGMKEAYEAMAKKARLEALPKNKWPKEPTPQTIFKAKKEEVEKDGVDKELMNNRREVELLTRAIELAQHEITLAVAKVDFYTAAIKGIGRN